MIDEDQLRSAFREHDTDSVDRCRSEGPVVRKNEIRPSSGESSSHAALFSVGTGEDLQIGLPQSDYPSECNAVWFEVPLTRSELGEGEPCSGQSTI